MQKRSLRLVLLFLATFVLSAPWASSQPEESEARTPAYHAHAPSKDAKLPDLLTKDQLWGDNAQEPYQTHAYELAAKIQAVLYQEPCYCYCDRMGHKSLRSCFESTHAAECSICLKELYFTYMQHKKGKTAQQIRQGIIHGDWKSVDLRAAATIN